MLRFSKPRLAVTLLLLVGALVSAPKVRAQFDTPTRPGDTTTIEKLRSGTVSYSSNVKKHEPLLSELAKWLAYRLVLPPYNGTEPQKKVPGLPENLETLMSEAERFLSFPSLTPPNDAQLEYAKAFGKALEYELMEVYQKSEKKLEKVNAARMLAMVGKLPYADVADTYLKIIRDGSYPLEIKLFAFEGLRNLLAIPDPLFPDVPEKHFIKSAAKLAEICNELEKFILQKHPSDMSAGEAQVQQYVRREAVRALAQIKISVIRQSQVPLAKPIWALLRVASNDKIVKPADAAMPRFGFTMPERIEAIIGVAWMAPDRDLNLDLVVDVINDAMIEVGAFQAKERTDFADPRNKPLVPWKLTGVRLIDAFKQWKTGVGVRNLHSPTSVVNFVDRALKYDCLPKLETDGVNAKPDYRAFDDWKRNIKPKAKQVLEDDATTIVEAK
jgi:hypothetical protein